MNQDLANQIEKLYQEALNNADTIYKAIDQNPQAGRAIVMEQLAKMTNMIYELKDTLTELQ